LGVHELPKVSLGPAISYLLVATPETALWPAWSTAGQAAYGRLITLSDTQCHTGLIKEIVTTLNAGITEGQINLHINGGQLNLRIIRVSFCVSLHGDAV
jgi:hypothetical protein